MLCIQDVTQLQKIFKITSLHISELELRYFDAGEYQTQVPCNKAAVMTDFLKRLQNTQSNLPFACSLGNVGDECEDLVFLLPA